MLLNIVTCGRIILDYMTVSSAITETDIKTRNKANHNRTTGMERSVIYYWLEGALADSTGITSPYILLWFIISKMGNLLICNPLTDSITQVIR